MHHATCSKENRGNTCTCGLDDAIDAALASAVPADFHAEIQLRKEWAFNHGCPAGIAAIYGDDGELHCNACVIDFKREPMGELYRRVTEKRMQRMQRASAAAAPVPADPTEGEK